MIYIHTYIVECFCRLKHCVFFDFSFMWSQPMRFGRFFKPGCFPSFRLLNEGLFQPFFFFAFKKVVGKSNHFIYNVLLCHPKATKRWIL